jgi:hypothetical protein
MGSGKTGAIVCITLMRLADALERVWTRAKDKRHAAILLRDVAVGSPHCHFCGCGPEGDLYDSRYHPRARICRPCAAEIAAEFTTVANAERAFPSPAPRRPDRSGQRQPPG